MLSHSHIRRWTRPPFLDPRPPHYLTGPSVTQLRLPFLPPAPHSLKGSWQVVVSMTNPDLLKGIHLQTYICRQKRACGESNASSSDSSAGAELSPERSHWGSDFGAISLIYLLSWRNPSEPCCGPENRNTSAFNVTSLWHPDFPFKDFKN